MFALMFQFGIQAEHSSMSVTLARLCGLTFSHIRPKFRVEYFESAMTSQQRDSERSLPLINLMGRLSRHKKQKISTLKKFSLTSVWFNLQNLQQQNSVKYVLFITTDSGYLSNRRIFGMCAICFHQWIASKTFLHSQIENSLNLLSYFLLCTHTSVTSGNDTCLPYWPKKKSVWSFSFLPCRWRTSEYAFVHIFTWRWGWCRKRWEFCRICQSESLLDN